MDAHTRNSVRLTTQRIRRAPNDPVRLCIPLAGAELADAAPSTQSIELNLEATDASGELAHWLDDWWWTDLLQRWSEARVTLVIAATPLALLHPVLMHQIEMLRRVATSWRLIGCGRVQDFADTDAALRLAQGAYHEVRIVDQPESACGEWLTVEQVFAIVRKYGADTTAPTPVLVRMPATI